MTVPAIDVDADLVPLGLQNDGAMKVPDFGLVGWYEEAPYPGREGPAVIAAHVDSRDGPDVFYRLDELDPGDEIVVTDVKGRTHAFEVTEAEQTPKDELPDRIWEWTDEPTLRLITCSGDFDPTTRSYSHNTIVYATGV